MFKRLFLIHFISLVFFTLWPKSLSTFKETIAWDPYVESLHLNHIKGKETTSKAVFSQEMFQSVSVRHKAFTTGRTTKQSTKSNMCTAPIIIEQKQQEFQERSRMYSI